MNLRLSRAELFLSESFSLGPLNHEFSGGSLCAVIGPNGAGKSSLFRLLTGTDDASEGEVLFGDARVHSHDYHHKRRLGYLPQPLEIPLWVSGWDVLHYIAALRDVPEAKKRVKGLIDLWQISSYQHRPLVGCSYGMRKRVALALAQLGDPPVMILDEPLSGLDVLHIASLRAQLRRRRDLGLCTIVSTHILSFACEEATEVVLMKVGKMQTLPRWPQWSYDERQRHLENFLMDTDTNVETNSSANS